MCKAAESYTGQYLVGLLKRAAGTPAKAAE
jgi:hypothetical protein